MEMKFSRAIVFTPATFIYSIKPPGHSGLSYVTCHVWNDRTFESKFPLYFVLGAN